MFRSRNQPLPVRADDAADISAVLEIFLTSTVRCSRVEWGMKVAFAGKGGVGKTTVAAALAMELSRRGRKVIAVDADPDSNLPSALGLSDGKAPEPVSRMKDLIDERTEARSGVFKLNPEVSDIPERFAADADGVRVLLAGTIERGGSGCFCPESAFLKALMSHILLRLEADVILDMDAGIELLGRGSARGVEAMVVVVEPGMRSVETAKRVRALASSIGIENVVAVANRIRQPEEEELLRASLGEVELVESLPYDEAIARSDLEGKGLEAGEEFREAIGRLANEIDTRGTAP